MSQIRSSYGLLAAMIALLAFLFTVSAVASLLLHRNVLLSHQLGYRWDVTEGVLVNSCMAIMWAGLARWTWRRGKIKQPA